jgi:hypothetical protein
VTPVRVITGRLTLSQNEISAKIFLSFSKHIYGTDIFKRTQFKGGCTPTASRQTSRHETKETKADVSIMTQIGVRRFS